MEYTHTHTQSLLNSFKDASFYCFILNQPCGDSSPDLVCNEINGKCSINSFGFRSDAAIENRNISSLVFVISTIMAQCGPNPAVLLWETPC